MLKIFSLELFRNLPLLIQKSENRIKPSLCQWQHLVSDALKHFSAQLHHVSPCNSVQVALLPEDNDGGADFEEDDVNVQNKDMEDCDSDRDCDDPW